MKSAVFYSHGNAQVLKFENTPDPVPQANEVLIKVHYSSVNHLDIWIRNGIQAYPINLPHILGADGAGVVEKIGPGAEGVVEGDRVLIIPGISCGQCLYCREGRDNQCETYEILGAKRNGAYAEYVAVPDQNVIPIPDSLSFEEAAAFPLAYLTAWHMLIGRAKLSPGESVLVVGASAGVGMAAIQIAKWRGAQVFALTSNPLKIGKIMAIGAEEVFVNKIKRGLATDVVFEHVGPDTWEQSIQTLKPCGRLVTCGATTGPRAEMDLRYLFSRDLTVMGARMGTKREFQDLASVVFSGKLKPVIDRVFPLNQASQAHQYIEEQQHAGKVLLKA